jgi:hypothetical protein
MPSMNNGLGMDWLGLVGHGPVWRGMAGMGGAHQRFPLRSWLNAIAIACLRLLTLGPLFEPL